MFLLVKTEEERRIFEGIVTKVQKEVNVPQSNFKSNSDLYMVKAADGKLVGGFECSRFNQEEEKHYNYKDNRHLKGINAEAVYQVGKIVILKEYRGKKLFYNILSALHDHYQRHQPDYYIGNLDVKLLRKLNFMGFHTKKLSGVMKYGKQEAIPVLIDTHRAYKHLKRINRASRIINHK